jgi:hypothetical protein
VPATGIYTVVHPFGQIEYNVVGLVAGQEVRDSLDIEFAPNATNQQGRVLPYLIWDPAIAPAAPAGYIGDPQILHEVVGSPCGNNFFQVIPPAGVDIGAGPGAPVTETLFAVQGKISTIAGVTVERATFVRGTGGGGKIDVFASSQTGQTIEVSGVGNNVSTMLEDPAGSGKYYTRMSFNPNNFPATSEITVTNTGDGLFVVAPLVDHVRIIRSRYDTDPADLFEIFADSTDRLAPRPILEAFDDSGNSLGVFFAGDTLIVTPKPVMPPKEITVVSSNGGQETRQVDVIGGTNIP